MFNKQYSCKNIHMKIMLDYYLSWTKLYKNNTYTECVYIVKSNLFTRSKNVWPQNYSNNSSHVVNQLSCWQFNKWLFSYTTHFLVYVRFSFSIFPQRSEHNHQQQQSNKSVGEYVIAVNFPRVFAVRVLIKPLFWIANHGCRFDSLKIFFI